MKFVFVAILSCFAASIAVAKIPQSVIDECNNTIESYDGMPECLKKGVIAFEMLHVALQADYYGPSAQSVIDGCRERNKTYATVWSCFVNTAKKASETRDLIGIENMIDRCYIAVSSPKIYVNFIKEYHRIRNQHIEDDYFYWGGSYYPFKGCPESESQQHSKLEEDKDEGISYKFSEQACRAYREFDELLASHTSAQIDTIFATIDSMPREDRLANLTMIGVSDETIQYMQSADEKEAKATVFALAALVSKHHPASLKRMTGGDRASENPNFGQITENIVGKLLGTTLEDYDHHCLNSLEG